MVAVIAQRRAAVLVLPAIPPRAPSGARAPATGRMLAPGFA
jgi:hypothetical protein